MTPVLGSALLRTQSDGRLLELARGGNERAFEAIVERYRKPLHRHCRRILGDVPAEDCVQNAFMKAWASIGEGAEIRDLRAWLYRVAQNSALDVVRRSGYDYAELSDSLGLGGDTEEAAEKRAVMHRTLVGLAELPDRQRDALLQTAVAGRSRHEVAEQMGLSEGAVRQLVHRARATLRSAATAITPLPLLTLAAGASPESAPLAQRVGELAAGAGTAGLGGALVKGGVVVVAAGALATAPGGPGLGVGGAGHGRAAASASAAAPSTASSHRRSGDSASSSDGARHRAGSHRGRGHGRRVSGSSGSGGHGSDDGAAEHSGSSGSGRRRESGDDRSTSSGGGDDSRSGSGSGSGSSGGDSSGGGSSGSGRDGSGSGDDAPLLAIPQSADSSGPSVSSGSGSSGSGSDSSGHGSSGLESDVPRTDD